MRRADLFSPIFLPVHLTLALVLGGCDGEAAADPAAFDTDTIAGVERLTYGAEPGPSLEWRADTVTVLGDAFAEDAYQFASVTPERLAADPAGNLYLLDQQGGRVLKYGPDGRHLATLGRPGGGPGELGQPLGLAVGPGDTAWVSDFDNTRLTGYPPDDGDPRTIPFPENAGIPSPRMEVDERGFIMQFRPLFVFGGGPGAPRMSRGAGADGGGPQQLPVLRLDPSLQPVDTLYTTAEPPMDMVQLESGNRMMITMMSREFWPGFFWDGLSDGGVVVADSAAYHLRWLGPDGETERVVRRDPAPRATTEGDRERARERVREAAEGGTSVRIGGGGADPDLQQKLLEQRIEKMTFADLIPRIVRLAVDPRDRVWVGVSEESADEVERIDVYDRDGRLVGELRDFPFPDVFLGDDRIGVLRRDELEVQQVVVLEVAQGQG